MPDKTRNSTPLGDRLSGRCHSCRAQRISAVTNKITMVRRKVARSEFISDTPTLPKIAVRAAKNADPIANTRQSTFILSVDTDHHVRRLDDGVDFGARLQPELFGRGLGDDRYNLDTRREFHDDFAVDRSGRGGLDGGGKNIACADFHGDVLLVRECAG